MPLQLRGMSETSWCIKQASCRKRICFLFKTIFVWLVHTCQGVPVSVETALLHHSLPTFMWDMGIKLRAPGLCSKCLYWMCHLPCPPPPNLSFQAWLYNICWCKYLSMRYLKKGLWLLHRQKEGPSRAVQPSLSSRWSKI